jgi:hypothetical protein
MSQITRSEIEQLAAVQCGHGQVVTCYADLTAEEGMQRHWRGRVKSVAEQIHRSLTFDEVALHDFDSNYHDVVDILESTEDEDSAGLAIFSAKLRDFIKVIRLEVPVPTELRLAPVPYLVPLLTAYFRQEDRYLVIEVDHFEARLFAAWPGHAALLEELLMESMKQSYSEPGKGSWSQKDISKRRQEALERHRDRLIAAVMQHWQTGRFDSVVLLGRGEPLDAVKEQLPQEVLEKVVHTASCPEALSPAAVEKMIGNIINLVRREHQQVLHTEFRRRTREGSGFAAGPRDVMTWLDAAPPSAHACLMLGSDRGRTVSRCVKCKHLNWYEVTDCPRCKAKCVPANLFEELLLRVFDNRWRVAFFEDHPSLLPFEGVALMYSDDEGGGTKQAG